MTEIVVASRDGILRAPDGTQYRMVRGKTLADARHPGVLANPNDFMPVAVELSMEDADPGYLEDDIAVELAELREKAAHAESAEADAREYKAQLVAIADTLRKRNAIPVDVDTDKPGWVADCVSRALAPASDPGPAPADDDVPPPAATRKPRAPRG